MQSLQLLSKAPITLRDYQQKAVDDVKAAYAKGSDGVLLVAPTGGGKTQMFCSLIGDWVAEGKRGVITAHRGELLTQAGTTLGKWGMTHGKIKAAPSTNKQASIQVASIASLRTRELPFDPDFIVVDEAHLAKSNSYMTFFNLFPYAKRLLVTATPCRSDGRGFADVADSIVISSTVNDLIYHPEGPFLVPPRMRSGSDLTGLDDKVRTTAGDYNQGDLEKVMIEIAGDVVESYKEHALGRKGVVFCVGIAHSKQVAADFNAAGIKAEHLDGEMSELQRSGVLNRLRYGETKIVTNANVLCEGWDEPSITYVGLARPTKSLALYIQQAGRGLRIHPGKEDCVILDHGGNFGRFGHICNPRLWSLDFGKPPKEEQPPECPDCGELFAYHQQKCPCGYVRKKLQIEVVSQTAVLHEKVAENPIVAHYRLMLRYCIRCKTGPKDFIYAFNVVCKKFGFDKAKKVLPMHTMQRMQKEAMLESKSRL